MQKTWGRFKECKEHFRDASGHFTRCQPNASGWPSQVTIEGLRAFLPGSHYLPGKLPSEDMVGTTFKVPLHGAHFRGEGWESPTKDTRRIV